MYFGTGTMYDDATNRRMQKNFIGLYNELQSSKFYLELHKFGKWTQQQSIYAQTILGIDHYTTDMDDMLVTFLRIQRIYRGIFATTR